MDTKSHMTEQEIFAPFMDSSEEELVAARMALTSLTLRLIVTYRSTRSTYLMLVPKFVAALDQIVEQPSRQDIDIDLISPAAARTYVSRADYEKRYDDPDTAEAFWSSAKASATTLARLAIGLRNAHGRPIPHVENIVFLQEAIVEAWYDALNATAIMAGR